MSAPLVSLITPCLNAEQFIGQTLHSVAEQDYPYLEHIIIDGKSSDATLDIIERLKGQNTKVYSGLDHGTSEAIAKGVALSQGKYLWMLNADDQLADVDTITVLVDFLEAHQEYDFAFGHMEMMDSQGKYVGNRFFRKGYGITDLLVDRRHLPFAGCLIRREVYESLGGFDYNYQFANDLDFFIRLALRYRMGRVDRVTGRFRLHSGASTSSNILASGVETTRICIEALQRLDVCSRLEVTKNEALACVYVFAAGYQFHDGTAKAVRANLGRAAQMSFKHSLHFKPIIYFFCSLFGDKVMRSLSRQIRRLIHVKYFYKVNNMG